MVHQYYYTAIITEWTSQMENRKYSCKDLNAPVVHYIITTFTDTKKEKK